MSPLEHISLLKAELDEPAFADHLDEFAHNHHVGIEDWLDVPWRALLVAETHKEKVASLDALAVQYKRLEFNRTLAIVISRANFLVRSSRV